MNKSKHKLRQI